MFLIYLLNCNARVALEVRMMRVNFVFDWLIFGVGAEGISDFKSACVYVLRYESSVIGV